MTDSGPPPVEERTTLPRLEVLYFAGCPNYERTRELVETAAAELGLAPHIELVEVEDAERTAELRFLGSPTVRVDGRDVEPGADEREDFAFSCRVYRTDQGLRETPDPLWIRRALLEAAA
jgi:hypothetical protein